MDAPEIRPLNPRLSPKLDVLLGGSDEVNQARAVQCPSVAGAEVAELQAPTALSPAEVTALAAELPQQAPAENSVFSLFVKLDRDLTPDARQAAIKAIGRHAQRSRWKLAPP